MGKSKKAKFGTCYRCGRLKKVGELLVRGTIRALYICKVCETGNTK